MESENVTIGCHGAQWNTCSATKAMLSIGS